jgi:hypothetical protein
VRALEAGQYARLYSSRDRVVRLARADKLSAGNRPPPLDFVVLINGYAALLRRLASVRANWTLRSLREPRRNLRRIIRAMPALVVG